MSIIIIGYRRRLEIFCKILARFEEVEPGKRNKYYHDLHNPDKFHEKVKEYRPGKGKNGEGNEQFVKLLAHFLLETSTGDEKYTRRTIFIEFFKKIESGSPFEVTPDVLDRFYLYAQMRGKSTPNAEVWQPSKNIEQYTNTNWWIFHPIIGHPIDKKNNEIILRGCLYLGLFGHAEMVIISPLKNRPVRYNGRFSFATSKILKVEMWEEDEDKKAKSHRIQQPNLELFFFIGDIWNDDLDIAAKQHRGQIVCNVEAIYSTMAVIEQRIGANQNSYLRTEPFNAVMITTNDGNYKIPDHLFAEHNPYIIAEMA